MTTERRVYRFQIELDGVAPPIWRTIEVPESYTLWDLHVAVQDAMGWLDYHIHEFQLRDPRSGADVIVGLPDADGWDDRHVVPDWDAKIAEYFTLDKRAARYLYDFGEPFLGGGPPRDDGHARRVWVEEADEGEIPERCLRDRQMARHLVWLANEGFPGRKIIAWAANGHVLRVDEVAPGAGSGPSMGQGVWEELGEASYAIATTSYRGTHGLAGASPSGAGIVIDQHPLPEFEELMEVAGREHALVDLRRAREEGSWLAGPFIARPIGYVAEERVWSRALDALLFLRDQHPPRRVERP